MGENFDEKGDFGTMQKSSTVLEQIIDGKSVVLR